MLFFFEAVLKDTKHLYCDIVLCVVNEEFINVSNFYTNSS